MLEWFSKLIDQASEFFAARKGLLPIIGIGLVLINLGVRLALPGWLASSDLLLHLGIIVAIFGLMLAWAL
jgi:hypothetical protein